MIKYLLPILFLAACVSQDQHQKVKDNLVLCESQLESIKRDYQTLLSYEDADYNIAKAELAQVLGPDQPFTIISAKITDDRVLMAVTFYATIEDERMQMVATMVYFRGKWVLAFVLPGPDEIPDP